jgi:hypothetical protein
MKRPGVKDEDIAHWHALMKKYRTHPVSHDFMLDYKLYEGRLMPFDEQVANVKKDIESGARLGMPYIRSVLKAGGLSAGKHKIELAERLRISCLPFVPTTKDYKELTLKSA